jgi:hypothetical protein
MLMGNIFGLLANLSDLGYEGDRTGASWGYEFLDALRPILVIILAVVSVIATVFVIYLGFMLAKAEDEGSRKKARKKFFNFVSGLIAIVFLTGGLFTWDLFANTTAPDNRTFRLVTTTATPGADRHSILQVGILSATRWNTFDVDEHKGFEIESSPSGVTVDISPTSPFNGTWRISSTGIGDVVLSAWVTDNNGVRRSYFTNRVFTFSHAAPPASSISNDVWMNTRATLGAHMLTHPNGLNKNNHGFISPVDANVNLATGLSSSRWLRRTGIVELICSWSKYHDSIADPYFRDGRANHNGIDVNRSAIDAVGARITRTVNGETWRTTNTDNTISNAIPIVAIADGVICNDFKVGIPGFSSARGDGWGNYVRIYHGGSNNVSSLYAHLENGSIERFLGSNPAGMEVKQGQILGFMGNTGQSYGTHLHFELRINSSVSSTGTPIDPLLSSSSPNLLNIPAYSSIPTIQKVTDVDRLELTTQELRWLEMWLFSETNGTGTDLEWYASVMINLALYRRGGHLSLTRFFEKGAAGMGLTVLTPEAYERGTRTGVPSMALLQHWGSGGQINNTNDVNAMLNSGQGVSKAIRDAIESALKADVSGNMLIWTALTGNDWNTRNPNRIIPDNQTVKRGKNLAGNDIVFGTWHRGNFPICECKSPDTCG